MTRVLFLLAVSQESSFQTLKRTRFPVGSKRIFSFSREEAGDV
jgi:hypothetical protein